MKQKLNFLIIAALFLIIMPLQFGCDKAEELQQEQTDTTDFDPWQYDFNDNGQLDADELETVFNDHAENKINKEELKAFTELFISLNTRQEENSTKSGFDPASATYCENGFSNIYEILSYWDDMNYQLCYNPCYINIEQVLMEWYYGYNMRADKAFILTYLQNLDKLALGRGIVTCMEMSAILTECYDVSATTVAVITCLTNTAEHIIKTLGLIGEEMDCDEFYLDISGCTILGDQLVNALSGTSYYIYGDANEDGIINMVDATYAQLIIMELKNPTRFADAKRDGEIDILDVTQIELIILGRARRVWFGRE